MEPHSTKQKWKFKNKNTENIFVQTFPNMTIEDWEFGLEFQRKPAEKIRNKSIFNWGQLMNGDKQSCLVHDSTSNTNEVVFHYCKISNDFEFEYTTDYTIRMLQSNQCLRVNDKKAFLEPCNSDSMRWGLNDMTRQIMEVQSIKCLEKHDAGHQWQLRLGPCNADQESKHQKWKEFYDPHYTNSTKLTRLTPMTILDWHRNYSIYDIPFPPSPEIILRKWNSQYTHRHLGRRDFSFSNRSKFDRIRQPDTTRDYNTKHGNTTPIANSSIHVLQESDLNQDGNRTKTDDKNEENDKKINNGKNILITQPEDEEKARINPQWIT